MRLYDSATYRQSHAHTVWFGRKESIKDTLEILGIEPLAGIAHRDNQIVRLILAAANGQFPFPFLAVRDCFRALDDQIQNHLLQLNSISAHERQTTGELAFQKNVALACFALGYCNNLDNNFVEINQIIPRRSLFHQRANSPDDLARPITVLDNTFNGLPRLNKIRLGAPEPPQTSVTVCDYRSKRLVNLVCDRSGQFSKGHHTRYVRQFRPHLLQRFLGALAFSDVVVSFKHGHWIPLFVSLECPATRDGDHTPIAPRVQQFSFPTTTAS